MTRVLYAALSLARVAAFSVSLETPLLRIVVEGSPSATCISSLAFSLTLAGEPLGSWTPNLLFGGPGCGGNLSYSASSTAMQTSARSAVPLLPTGGHVSQSTATTATISNIDLGNGLATEEWDVSVNGGALSWTVRRIFHATGVAESDQAPALAFVTSAGAYSKEDSTSRGHVSGTAFPDWRESVQMPSFSNIDSALIDVATGGGYPVRGGTGLAILGDATHGGARRVLLSPSGVAMLLNHSDCRFAVSRPVAIFVSTLAVGAECAAGPAGAAGYAFTAGDSRSTSLVAEFVRADQGHGLFDLSVPPGSPAALVAQQAALAVKVFQLPSGFINGNSPACESCLHEMGIFPQLEMILRLEPPPVEQGNAGIRVPTPASVHEGTAHFFNYVLGASVNASGAVAPRWSVDGGNDWSFPGIIDQCE